MIGTFFAESELFGIVAVAIVFAIDIPSFHFSPRVHLPNERRRWAIERSCVSPKGAALPRELEDCLLAWGVNDLIHSRTRAFFPGNHGDSCMERTCDFHLGFARVDGGDHRWAIAFLLGSLGGESLP
jgi:hypothetical protein